MSERREAYTLELVIALQGEVKALQERVAALEAQAPPNLYQMANKQRGRLMLEALKGQDVDSIVGE